MRRNITVGYREKKMERSPTPWRSEKVPGGYAVRDARGRIVAQVFGQDVPCESRFAPMTMDEAKEMALNIAEAGPVLSEPVEANAPRQVVA
jgi:hypothetical protein